MRKNPPYLVVCNNYIITKQNTPCKSMTCDFYYVTPSYLVPELALYGHKKYHTPLLDFANCGL